MTEPQKEYIITEERISRIAGLIPLNAIEGYKIIVAEIHSRPYTSAEKVLMDVELAIRAVAINDPDIRTRYCLHLIDCLNILNKIREELRQECKT